MSKQRTTIYPGAPIQDLFHFFPGSSQSTTLNTTVDRYLHLIARNIPDLTARDWEVIFQAYRHADPLPPSKIHLEWSIVEEAFRTGGIAGDHHLVEKLKGFSFAQMMAVRELADRFWAQLGEREVPDFEAQVDWVREQRR